MKKGKVIILDGGIVSHKCIFAWGGMVRRKNNGEIPEDKYNASTDRRYLISLLALLKRIVVKRGDTVIVAVDARNSWRKAFLPDYKGNRRGQRNTWPEIDWAYHYALIEDMNQKLNASTDWHFVKLSDFATFEDLKQTEEGKKYEISGNQPSYHSFGIEADDIQAVACTVFDDREVVLVTGDDDLLQLAYFDNTKIFSTKIKFLAGTGCYSIVENPLKILADKIRLGDKSDNIIIPKKDSDQQRGIREFIINLLKLPSFIEDPIKKILTTLPEKQVIYEDMPFKDSIGSPENFSKIYLPDKMITWEQAERRHKKEQAKKEKKRLENNEKARLKRQAKKAKEFK